MKNITHESISHFLCSMSLMPVGKACFLTVGLFLLVLLGFVSAYDAAETESAQSSAVSATTSGVITAASCSQIDVQNAIKQVSSGGTVTVPAGNCTWASTVIIPSTKGITLQVQGGTYTPPPGNFPLLVTCATGADPCLRVDIGNGNPVTRVTGFHFTSTFATADGAVFVQGQGLGPSGVGAFRIDNNFFDRLQVDGADLQGTLTVWGLGPNNPLTGVIDHNHFLDSSKTDSYVIAIGERWKYGGNSWANAGQNAWTRPLAWGTSDFIFIEDNLIEQQSGYARHLIEAIQGAKYVARHNTFIDNKANPSDPTVTAELVEAHGFCFCTNIGHGTRGGEIYSNTFGGTQVDEDILLRGGSWLVYDNTFQTDTGRAFISLLEYRAGDSGMYSQCTATCPSDPTWFLGPTDASHYPMHEQIGYNLAGQSEPSYMWNNLYQFTNQCPVVDSAGVQPLYIQSGRDYFCSSSKPGALASYTPFTYPHPLVSGTTPPSSDASPPSVPTGLTATAVSSSQIILSWNASTDNVEVVGYMIFKNGTQVGTSATTSYQDTGLSPSMSYSYTVSAYDSAGNNSAQSNSASATTLAMTPPPGGGGGGGVTTPPPTSTGVNFIIPDNGGAQWLWTGNSDSVATIGYAAVQMDTDVPPSGIALVAGRVKGILVSEGGISASPSTSSGRTYVYLKGPMATAISFANKNSQDALISYYFTSTRGTDFFWGTFTLTAGQKIAAFLNQPPFDAPSSMEGTFTFSSSIPVGAVALQGLTNEAGNFLYTTVPVAPVSGSTSNPVIVPAFVDGGGWSTQVFLINPSDGQLSGTVQFYGQGSLLQAAQPMTITVNGTNGSTFNYAIPPHSAARLTTAGNASKAQSGSLWVIPTSGGAPTSAAILSEVNNGITVTLATVAGLPMGTAFRTYAEVSGIIGQAGSVQTGVAIANPSPEAVTANLQLTQFDGSSLGLPVPVTVPGNGQIAQFLQNLISPPPSNFRGFLKVTSLSPIAVTALRTRYNELGNFLITTTTPRNDSQALPAASDVVLPSIVTGGGYTTQFVVFGQAGAGKLRLDSQLGTIANFN